MVLNTFTITNHVIRWQESCFSFLEEKMCIPQYPLSTDPVDPGYEIAYFTME